MSTPFETSQEEFGFPLSKPTSNDIVNAFKENEAFTKEKKSPKTLNSIFFEEISEETPIEEEKTINFVEDFSISPSLSVVINKLLSGIPPNDQELQQLNEIERDLFNSVRDKKVWTDEDRNKGLLSINEKSVVKRGKRIEESQKLFFKKAYAYIESNFFKTKLKNKKKIQKRHKNYEEFYFHYFGETAKELNIQLENFYHPQKSFKKKGNVSKNSKSIQKTQQKKPTKYIIPGQKSFNKTYIDLILKSKTFKKDLEFYLHNYFVKDCEENRQKKVMKFLNYCNKIKDDICLLHSITTPPQNREQTKKFVTSALRKYVLNDSKAKIPWSDDEIRQAYDVCKGLLGI